MHKIIHKVQGQVKSSRPSLRKTLDKRPLGKDPDRSWCHRHTTSWPMIKLSWSQPMAPWNSAAAAAAQSMDPWAAIKKASQECGGDISTCPGPYPTAACPEFHVG